METLFLPIRRAADWVVLRIWRRRMAAMPRASATRARRLRARARRLTAVLQEAERLATDQLVAAAAAPATRPPGERWRHAPAIWTAPARPRGAVGLTRGAWIDRNLEVYFDANRADVAWRQIRGRRGGARYGLRLETFEFLGPYLSLSLVLPPEAAPSEDDVVELRAQLDTASPVSVRLTLEAGPNTVQRAAPLADGLAEFDLAGTGIAAGEATSWWLDVIFERPRAAVIDIYDLSVALRARAVL